jgi:hypothetical protein
MHARGRFCRTKSRILLVLFVLAGSSTGVLLSTGCELDEPPHPGPGVPTQQNTDGYNYLRYKDGIADFMYNQLWYFNFLDERGTPDPSDDIAGVGAYGLANPENKLFQKGVVAGFGMIIRDPSQGESFKVNTYSDPAVPGNFQASRTFEPNDPIKEPNPDLPCGDPNVVPPGEPCHLQTRDGYITVISPDHYHIAGDVAEGVKRITWDLHYRRRLAPPWLIWVEWPVPRTLKIFPAWINYPMQMADALVTGTFTADDDTSDETPAVVYELKDVKGYHDGFHSEFVFSIFDWDWLDYKQDNLSIQLLHPHEPRYSCKGGWETCCPGNLRVVYDDGSKVKVYDFFRGKKESEKQIWIEYHTRVPDPAHGVEYPTKETITAKDADGNKLELNWDLLRQQYVYYDVPAPYDDNITFEMIVHATGSFYEASSGTTVPISGIGWADWSGPSFPETEEK